MQIRRVLAKVANWEICHIRWINSYVGRFTFENATYNAGYDTFQDYVRIENTDDGRCDHPVRYHDGRVAYDYPDMLKDDVRKRTQSEMHKLFMAGILR